MGDIILPHHHHSEEEEKILMRSMPADDAVASVAEATW